ncbi:hypothetical protein L228DRAFT_248654 [Xylona heveae TC161]|uniref:Uncharacterized protein n=1 Tax=Xylona heveae (strain CBS 132557 / TC161) TaxID=1328760 RepID=A0A165G8Z0_XYLHT|nr:hypothetical protein L228DRAFT_248654 [Xylona heveae TC161]KZF21888.1 hypothetical protein L228DRAFT_248654 [Xylona heveae TC161]
MSRHRRTSGSDRSEADSSEPEEGPIHRTRHRYSNSNRTKSHTYRQRVSHVPPENTSWVDLPWAPVPSQIDRHNISNGRDKCFDEETDVVMRDIASSHRYQARESNDSPISLKLQEPRLSRIGLVPAVRWVLVTLVSWQRQPLLTIF